MLKVMKKRLTKFATLLIFPFYMWGEIEFRDASFKPVAGYSEISYEIGSEERKLYVSAEILLDSSAVEDAFVARSGTSTDDLGNTEIIYGVGVVLTDKGATEMKRVTKDRISAPIAIIVNGEVLSVPLVRAEIGKRLTITGAGSKLAAEEMKQKIMTKR